MGLFNKNNWLGRKVRGALGITMNPAPQVINLQRSYDSADTNRTNENHWQWAKDNTDANATASKEVRQILKNRVRYETNNNAYARGIVDQISMDTVGTLPRLQLVSEDKKLNKEIEKSFTDWMKAVRFAETLRLNIRTKLIDGEYFTAARVNRRINNPIKLDLVDVVSDRVTTPTGIPETALSNDGLIFDKLGNVIEYQVQKANPGDQQFLNGIDDWSTLPASQMYHGFKKDRPSQIRGVTEFAATLSLFAHLRQYKGSVMAAAEAAANISAVMISNAEHVEPKDLDAGQTHEIPLDSMVTIASGWDIKQLRAEQPVSTHEQFVRENVKELGRGMNVPYNKAANDSSGYNYSSARLDNQSYEKRISIEREELQYFMDWVFSLWLRTAALEELKGNIDINLPIEALDGLLPHKWHFDGFAHVDPLKEANADIKLVESGMLNMQDVAAKRGLDWEDLMDQRTREKEKAIKDELQYPYLNGKTTDTNELEEEEVEEEQSTQGGTGTGANQPRETSNAS